MGSGYTYHCGRVSKVSHRMTVAAKRLGRWLALPRLTDARLLALVIRRYRCRVTPDGSNTPCWQNDSVAGRRLRSQGEVVPAGAAILDGDGTW